MKEETKVVCYFIGMFFLISLTAGVIIATIENCFPETAKSLRKDTDWILFLL